MPRSLKITMALLLATGIAAWVSLQTGFARWAFFELFERVKNVEMLSQTVVREFPDDSPYERWLDRARQEIPVFDGLVIDDIRLVALKPWPQLGDGITGLYLRFADYQMTDGRIVEIPAGSATTGQRHLYEKVMYVAAGSGYSEMQQEGQSAQRVDWSEGDLLAIPLNAAHRHVNGGTSPARLLMVTSFPLLMNLIDDEGFIRSNPHVFLDRYDGSPGYFEPVPSAEQLIIETPLARDIRTAATQPLDYRGVGNTTVRWEMAGNSMLDAHISEMPPRMYKKAHRHSSDAFILLLSGTGFSLTWPEDGFGKRERVDWKAGTLFVPPTYWYHQHLNTGPVPARYLAVSTPVLVRNLGLRFTDQMEVDLEAVRDQWKQEIERQH